MSGAPLMCKLLALTHKHKLSWKGFARAKHSSLLRTFVVVLYLGLGKEPALKDESLKGLAPEAGWLNKSSCLAPA
jgi:hypothetical protein